NVGLLAVSGWFITAMAMAGAAGVTMNYFTPSALIRLAAIVRTTGRYGERLVTHEATLRLLAKLRVWFYEHLEPLAPAVLENYRSGDVLSRIRADIDTLNNVYLRLLVPTVVAVLAVCVFALALLWYHPVFALVEVSLLAIAGIGIPWLVNRWGNASGQQLITTSAALRSALVSDLQGMGELLVYGAADAHAAQIQQLSTQIASHQQQLSRINGIAQGALGLCANLALWLMLLIAIPLVNDGTLAPPELAMLALFALASFEAIAPLPLAFQSLGETLAAARRIFSLADSLPAVREPLQPLTLPQRLDWQCTNLSFAYGPDEPLVLRDLSFDLAQGQKLAIVGASGVGKSTLISLLLRFREPTSGEILLGRRPLAHYHSAALRQQIAVVPQHAHLFNATIRANLLLAKPDATPTELEAVCRTALLHDFIVSQPEGYATWVGEAGIKLSGGQIKRLALARALLKPAKLLILDEPTEGLDSDTAQQVMANVLAHVDQHGQSLLLITHQRHGLAAMDQVLELHNVPRLGLAD
ncbi:MAG: thiol reductant ABC exporter subunit CydC, partial [Thiothrix sp.]